VLAGEACQVRTELGREAELGREIATLAHVTDAHVLDASSPARVGFLARFGQPFESAFRPQEALTAQVLAGALRAVRALRPDCVIEGGDLIDNAQENELGAALALFGGGSVAPGSGTAGYFGVQSPVNDDDWYYRPDRDDPQHPGLLDEATRPFRSAGIGAPWLPVLGDHDVLVAGELVPNDLTRALAIGERALWTPPAGFSIPAEVVAGASAGADSVPLSVLAGLVGELMAGPTVEVPADPARRELEVGEVVERLRVASGAAALPAGSRLDYVHDVGRRLRVIVLDLASRSGGSGGVVLPEQVAFVEDALAGAGDRWVVFVCHQTLRQSAGGDELQALLDASPRVALFLNGHTHHNRIRPRDTAAGGHWEIETSSLIDWPQQCRALRLFETDDGGLAIQTWMLDHVTPAGRLGLVSRELAWMDETGGRPGRFAGGPGDRNALLHLRARRRSS